MCTEDVEEIVECDIEYSKTGHIADKTFWAIGTRHTMEDYRDWALDLLLSLFDQGFKDAVMYLDGTPIEFSDEEIIIRQDEIDEIVASSARARSAAFDALESPDDEDEVDEAACGSSPFAEDNDDSSYPAVTPRRNRMNVGTNGFRESSQTPTPPGVTPTEDLGDFGI
jgi:hypothetical protein